MAAIRTYSKVGNVTPERLRVASRALIAAAADQRELLVDEHWQQCMINISVLLNKFEEKVGVPNEPTGGA